MYKNLLNNYIGIFVLDNSIINLSSNDSSIFIAAIIDRNIFRMPISFFNNKYGKVKKLLLNSFIHHVIFLFKIFYHNDTPSLTYLNNFSLAL